MDLLVLVVREKVDQRTEKAGFDDEILVLGEDGDVADAGGGGEDEGEEGGAEEAEEWRKAVELDDFELVLLCAALRCQLGLGRWLEMRTDRRKRGCEEREPPGTGP